MDHMMSGGMMWGMGLIGPIGHHCAAFGCCRSGQIPVFQQNQI